MAKGLWGMIALKRHCLRSILLRWKLLEVINRCPKSCSTIFLVQGYSSQAVHSWLKCREKPQMHPQQIRTSYVYYCSSKLTIFFLLQCCYFVNLWQKINFWKVGLNLLEKQLIYNLDPQLCFGNYFTAQESLKISDNKHATTFWNFVCSW